MCLSLRFPSSSNVKSYLSATIGSSGSSDKISFLVFGFHTNSTRDTGIASIGTPNMEGLQPAIEAQEHINAASQALKNGNNSEVSLQLDSIYILRYNIISKHF
jgi:hypothetical protein